MAKQMTTRTATFIDPSEESAAEHAFAIFWSNFEGGENVVTSPFSWDIVYSHGAHGLLLRDRRGEARPIPPGEYHSAIEYIDWSAYDALQTKRCLDELKQTLATAQASEAAAKRRVMELEEVLLQVYDITAAAGHGSRANVKRLIDALGINHCPTCGHVKCTCVV